MLRVQASISSHLEFDCYGAQEVKIDKANTLNTDITSLYHHLAVVIIFILSLKCRYNIVIVFLNNCCSIIGMLL